MLDLTNFDHRRGVVILSSKDMRVNVQELFRWKVNSQCIDGYIEDIRRCIISDTGMDDNNVNECLHKLDAIERWLKEADEHIDKAREIFR